MAQLNAEWGRFQWKSRIAENSCGLADSFLKHSLHLRRTSSAYLMDVLFALLLALPSELDGISVHPGERSA